MDTRRFAGIDWGGTSHFVCVVDGQLEPKLSFTVEASLEGLDELAAKLHDHGTISGVAIEGKATMLMHRLLEAGLAVYPVNPKLSHDWRKTHSLVGSKSDAFDARVLAIGLAVHHNELHPFRPDDPHTRELAQLCQDECSLIKDRTALVNRLQATLKTYYPQALQWFSDWTAATAWDFILTFSTPEKLRSASRKKLIGFLKTHKIGLGPRWQERLDAHPGTQSWPNDEPTVSAKSMLAVTLAKQLRTLQAALREYRRRIEELFSLHVDAAIFNSLPGAGDKMAPRLLSCIGADRQRYESAASLQELSGCAPVTKASGKRRTVRIRRACQKHFRDTLFLFANLSRRKCAWAQAYYKRARDAGDTHATALRKLGGKWLKIIFRMWQDRRPYDDQTYCESLVRHNSPLAKCLCTDGG